VRSGLDFGRFVPGSSFLRPCFWASILGAPNPRSSSLVFERFVLGVPRSSSFIFGRLVLDVPCS